MIHMKISKFLFLSIIVLTGLLNFNQVAFAAPGYIEDWQCGYDQDTSWCEYRGSYWCSDDAVEVNQVYCGGNYCGVAKNCVVSYPTPPSPVYGCTDPSATNYNSSATVDDGSCSTICVPHACDAPMPSCDSGPRTTSGSDGCGNGCQLSISCHSAPVCGNGSIESGEQCDSGASNGSCPRDCSNSCTVNSCSYEYPTPAYDYPTPGEPYGYPTPAAPDYPTPTPGVSYTLTAALGSGSGTITGTGINCPGDCSELYPSGTLVNLLATPASGYAFSVWTGACSGSSTSCSVTVSSDKTVGASFIVPFNYSLSNSGTSNVIKGSGNTYTQNTITKTLLAGTPESVTLTLSGVPSGVSYSLAAGTCAPTCSTGITFTVAPSAPTGTHQITVTGTPLGKTTVFNLVITASSAGSISVSCSASPIPSYVGGSVTWTGTVSGGTPPYTYSWSGSSIPTFPAPSSNPYSIAYTTSGQKTALLTVTDADGAQGDCSNSDPSGTGGSIYINFDPSFKEF